MILMDRVPGCVLSGQGIQIKGVIADSPAHSPRYAATSARALSKSFLFLF